MLNILNLSVLVAHVLILTPRRVLHPDGIVKLWHHLDDFRSLRIRIFGHLHHGASAPATDISQGNALLRTPVMEILRKSNLNNYTHPPLANSGEVGPEH